MGQRTEAVWTVRELNRQTHAIMRKVRETNVVAVVTVSGEPTVKIEKVDPDALAAMIVGMSSEYRHSMAEAEKDLASGDAKTLDQFIDTLS